MKQTSLLLFVLFFVSPLWSLTQDKATIPTMEEVTYAPEKPKALAKNETATVRQGDGLCWAEFKALEQRFLKAHQEFQVYVNAPVALNMMPLIGLCASGGGFRAAVAYLGMLKGLEKIGLLNCVSYAATLSGSTWLQASWFAQNKNFNDLEKYLREKMNNAFSLGKVNIESIVEKIWQKFINGRSISINDVWGALLGNVFLDQDDGTYGQRMMLSDLANIAASGSYPIPIFTSVLGQTSPYEWMEYTPFEIGSSYLQAWIEPKAFGKKFKDGISTDTCEAENLGYLLGVFGSAYAISIKDLLEHITVYVQSMINKSKDNKNLLANFILAITDLQRLSPPSIYNFSYKIPDSPLKGNKYLTLIDGGFSINLPMPALLRRNLNVYIICDASADNFFPRGSELKKVIAYAEKNNIPFPKITFDSIAEKPISIFYDPDNVTIPTVIYIPNFVDVSTLNFNYGEKTFSTIMDGIEQAIIENQDAIKTRLKHIADIK